MLKWFRKKKGIEDLKSIEIEINGVARKSVPIAVIDDEPFPYAEILRRHDFDVREIGDINDIKAIESYGIILCDIKGVGSHFGSNFEGGHIIEEINRYYPHKVKIAYTAQQFDPTYNKFFGMCDFSLKKDIDSDEWVEFLDKAIKLSTSPINQWKKVRTALLKQNISTKTLVLIEDEFVRRVLGDVSEFPSRNITRQLPEEAKTIILNLVSNIVFSSIFGFPKP